MSFGNPVVQEFKPTPTKLRRKVARNMLRNQLGHNRGMKENWLPFLEHIRKQLSKKRTITRA